MKKLHLPSLRGSFGKWIYFSTVMKVKDAVMNKRLITVSESKELYTSRLNDILQREYDGKRIEQIKDYLITIKERFFSSLVVAIHKGEPQWSDFDIEEHFQVDDNPIKKSDAEFLENKIGVLTLSGEEEMFVLDGQHRLLGLRKAYAEDNSIGEEEISLILVVHQQALKEKTRRLFTVLNRYAVKPKPAELVILEEDDAAAILTRKLVEEYPLFKHKTALSVSMSTGKEALNKGFAVTAGDETSFTTLVSLYRISQILISYKSLYKSGVISRPTDEALDTMWETIKVFWDSFFETFPDVKKYILGQKVPANFKRNSVNGGSLLLRPEGQLLIADVYAEFRTKNSLLFFWQNIYKIDFNLNGVVWKYVFWVGGKIESKNKKLKKEIMLYLLGEKKNTKYVSTTLGKLYKDHNELYANSIKPVV
ncbi:MAG: DNA sulfur modification protein DndB [Janthinobacterium lividum]